jgi:indolepyruvate ferredoxin oxidoreductase alpha subunit
MMELIGGMVIILGDDPGANSSQNEQDNRWFSRMSYIPMLEPSGPREAYRMYREAARLSVEHRSPVFLRLTTHVCHAREVVDFQGIEAPEPDWTPRFDAANGPYVPIARTVFPLKRRALGKLRTFEEIGVASDLNRVIAGTGETAGTRRLGIVASGLPAMAALEALGEGGVPVDVLKLGMTYPLPPDLVARFLEAHDEVLVLEELDRVLENEIKALAWDRGAGCGIRARTDVEDLMGELGPRRVAKILAETWPDLFTFEPEAAPEDGVPPRLPQMCPGCGHRSAFHAIRKALDEGDITVGDIGCHSLGFMPPYDMGEVLFSMGHGVSTASGMAINNRSRKVLTFIGDSTLIHAGMPGIVNAATYDHNITLMLMDNGTTAMTGHQPRFGSGEVGAKMPLVPLLEALGVKFIREVDAYEQAKLTEVVREANLHEGFAVVIARHPCMLKFTRDQRRRMPGFRMPAVRVDQEKCERIYECVARFGCPSFVRHEDGSVTVNEDLCIGDGSCLQTCPTTALSRPRPGGDR